MKTPHSFRYNCKIVLTLLVQVNAQHKVSKAQIQQAALMLRQAAETGSFCAPVRNIIGDTDLKAAYAVQALNNDYYMSKGAKVIAKKVGLTSAAVQRQLGVSQPDFGVLFHNKEVLHQGTIAWNHMHQPKAEGEIAFVLAKDLKQKYMSIKDVLLAIDFAVAAIEVVGSRIKDWDIAITDTIADNASCSHFVLGHKPQKISDLDLLHCKMQLWVNDKPVSEGIGSATLGSPINALYWLAQTMMQLNSPLKAGDLVLTGALGPVYTAQPGDNVKINIEGLGDVAVNFGHKDNQ